MNLKESFPLIITKDEKELLEKEFSDECAISSGEIWIEKAVRLLPFL